MKLKDYFLSGDIFEISYNKKYDMYETFLPPPPPEKLEEYYNEDYIPHTDGSKKSFIDKLYIFARKFSLKNKLRLIKKNIKKGNLLDYGCGTGEFLKTCERKGYNVNGIEPNEQAKKITIKKITGNITSNTNLNLIENEKYDIITLWHVLEHIPDYKKAISHFKRILKKNGTLIIAVPNYKSFDAKYYKEYWAGYDVPRHLWHFSKKSIQILFSEINMKIIKIKPMWLDSIYVSMLSEKYKKSKFNFIKAVIIGIISNFLYIFTRESSSQIYILKNEKLET